MTDRNNCSADIEDVLTELREEYDTAKDCDIFNLEPELLKRAADEIERLRKVEILHYEETKRSNAFEAECDRLRGLTPDVAQSVGMREALERIAKQQLVEERLVEGGDYEYGYEQIVKIARAALASQPSPAATVETAEVMPANLRSVVDALQGRFFECGGHMREMSEREAFDIALALRRASTKSAPTFQAPQNNAERLPSSDAAEVGADTQCSAATGGERRVCEPCGFSCDRNDCAAVPQEVGEKS